MKTNRLRAYGSTALGTTALLASHSDAATIVDVNASFYDTGLSGIGTVQRTGSGDPYTNSNIVFDQKVIAPSGNDFRRDTDTATITPLATDTTFSYAYDEYGSLARNGALLNSSNNWFYAQSTASTDQQVWLQFQFGGQGNGTGFSIIKAVYPDSPGELPSAFAASTAVPEPSALALLSLGASGLLIRRRKQAA